MFYLLIAKLCFWLLSLRYKIEIKGWDKLSTFPFKRSGGILFLPNHPAHMDPLFNVLLLFPKFRVRPLVVEYIFRQKWLGPIMRLVGAIPVPNFETSVNQFKIRQAEKAVQKIGEGLRQKENYLLYPSGKLKGEGREKIGGASAAYELMETCKEVNVVLIRTTGLWGSSFSRAIEGKSPHLFGAIVRGIGYVLKNGIFFLPRRKVVIEIEAEPPGLPRGESKVALNQFLEKWFNQYPEGDKRVDEEPCRLVSYAFWKKEVPVIAPKAKREKKGGDRVSDETRAKVFSEIRKILNHPKLEVKEDLQLAYDLGMDSLDVAELSAFLMQKFNVTEVHPGDLETVQSVLELAEGGKGEAKKREVTGISWKEERGRPLSALPVGETVGEAFLHAVDRLGTFAAVGDDTAGILSYKRLKQSALVLSQLFQKWEEERIAVMLPASVGAMVVVLALELAGKVPVMLNWTLGPKVLEEMVALSGAKRVLTSWRFLERLSHVDFGTVSDQILFLEDLREELSLKMKAKGLFLSCFGARFLKKVLPISKTGEETAVILFTSGTESSPKGVPLSHRNILSNQRSAMQCVDLKGEDVLFGILPPFHSFGFSVAGLFPILGGIKVAFYPDPTDSLALAEAIERWKISLFCAAPSFLKSLLRAATREQLRSVRLYIVGAEKSPEELFERVAKMGARLIEGYGITECAPILTINRPNLPPKGVGQLLPDVEAILIHPETLEAVKEGDGEVCVRGPNVFKGYLGSSKNPFIAKEGKQWYRTGDIGHFDRNGNLILSGRLKRFTKLGGEMISLTAIEEALISSLAERNDLPQIAVLADERQEGKPEIILFTTLSVTRDEVNERLQRQGFSRLVKVSRVEPIAEIPLLGTGKTDYRRLQGFV
jgi:long-chain-fatty-acid--[acyl-carrier-protein] ligase